MLEGDRIIELGVGRVTLPDMVGCRLGEARDGQAQHQYEKYKALFHLSLRVPYLFILFRGNVK
jgi:hypothetical protein